ncbi:hypothetical protein L484_004138 [Morus notabilis]|uniref:Uncharacterized protein n=1 Tax=Morus notabilis TaxID=981085 RepID=W9S5N7_9ROSA|nr:hypothetical protein L484_004138 [Morus notabilis]
MNLENMKTAALMRATAMLECERVAAVLHRSWKNLRQMTGLCEFFQGGKDFPWFQQKTQGGSRGIGKRSEEIWRTNEQRLGQLFKPKHLI